MNQISVKLTVGSFHGVVAKVLNCGIVVSEFKLQLCCYVHFQTNAPLEWYEIPYPFSYRLNSTNTVLL